MFMPFLPDQDMEELLQFLHLLQVTFLFAFCCFYCFFSSTSVLFQNTWKLLGMSNQPPFVAHSPCIFHN